MKAALARLWIRLTADRKQFGMLCGLLGIGLLLWARLIVASDMPKMAIADPAAPEPPVAPVAPSDKPVLAVVRVDLDTTAGHDPFSIDTERFPRPTVPDVNDPVPPKSGGEPTEDPERGEAVRLQQLQGSVDSMSLDAVLFSASLVVIDGRRYRQGDAFMVEPDGQRFVVAEVRQRSVVLEAEGRRFELKMSIPVG